MTTRLPVPLALIGAGAMGANHARVIAGDPQTRLALVVDSDAARARRIAERYDCRWATDLDDVPTRAAAAVIATSTSAHPPVAEALLSHDLPLLVEKPLAASLASAAAMVAAAETRDLPLMCGFVERYNPAVVTARHLLQGQPVHFVAQRHSPPDPSRRPGGSVVADLLIHDIDLAIQLLGTGEATRVTGGLWPPAAEGADEVEIADALVLFRGGTVANLSASRMGQRKNRSISIVTTHHLVELDLLRADVTVYRHVRFEESTGPGYRAQTVVDIPFVRHEGEPLAVQLRRFVALLNGDADPTSERQTILPAHEIMERVARAAARLPLPRQPAEPVLSGSGA